MRDYTSNGYCDFLWISDLLLLKKVAENEYRAVLSKCGQRRTVTIKNVMIFGTIVEIKQIGDRGILYSIDDGTGIICCKHVDQTSRDVLDIIQTERSVILNETFSNISNISLNESLFDNTLSEDDTIFNDKSLQEEEAAAIKRNRLKALHSIWCDVEESFSSMVKVLNIGDTVIIEGKLYTYFNTNQIYINSIRLIDVKEEAMLIKIKLEDGYDPVFQNSCKDKALTRIQAVVNNRRSGIMTFDNIPHMERNDIPTMTCLISRDSPKRVKAEKKQRKSIVPPHLQGTMTFDTMPNLDDSGPQN